MNLEEYQKETNRTAIYPGAGTGSVEAINYVIHGLAGEAGEVSNKWKKVLRDAPRKGKWKGFLFFKSQGEPVISEEVKMNILSETGDCLWYLARLNKELRASLDQTAEENLNKLRIRMENNKIGGSGDSR